MRGSDSSLGMLLLHPHTLVMWSAEEESCHQSVPGPSEQGRSTGGSSGWPTFSLSQHLKVSTRSARAQPGDQAGPRETLPAFTPTLFDEVRRVLILSTDANAQSNEKKKKKLNWLKKSFT